MQVIYLLGIGRFYSYGAQYQDKGASGQSSMAINSFLSSTLSSQFNQILSNAEALTTGPSAPTCVQERLVGTNWMLKVC